MTDSNIPRRIKMDISIFLAKVLSLYLIIVTVAMYVNASSFKEIILDFLDNKSLMLLGAVISLIIGILLVVSHNFWHWNWTIVITLLAWLTFLKGITNTVCPKMNAKWIRKYVEHKTAYNINVLVWFLIGLYLAYYGFIVY